MLEIPFYKDEQERALVLLSTGIVTLNLVTAMN